MSYLLFFFFFQAEDGIRDATVTGVQTCALPISLLPDSSWVGDVELVVPPEDHQTKPRSRRYGVATTFINSHPSQATRSGNKSTTGVAHRSHSADRYPLQVVIQQVTAIIGIPMPR